jgi:uncharacterized protein (DUF952 family)
LPSGRSPKLAAFVALAGPPDLLTRYRAPLLTLRQAQDEDFIDAGWAFELLIFKIIPRGEWAASSGDYHGSGHDRADGFLHFSTASQLEETLRRYYSGQDDLMLVAVDAAALGDALKWEYSESRGEDFPHLYAPLFCDALKWARPIAKDAHGAFLLPDLA